MTEKVYKFVLFIGLVALILVSGLCSAATETDAGTDNETVADEAEPEAVADVAESEVVATADENATVNMSDWQLVTVTDLYEVMIPQGWKEYTTETETGTVTGIMDESNPEELVVISITENTLGAVPSETELKTILSSFLEEAKITTSGESALLGTDIIVATGQAEDGTSKTIIIRGTEDYMISVIGSYTSPENAEKGGFLLGAITGTINPL